MLPPEKLGLYENSLMEEYLTLIGKRVFVTHYLELKNGTARLEECSPKSARQRLRAAKELFRQNFHVAALKKIASSRYLPPETVELAKDLLVYETLSLREYYLSLD